ncbi:hypothetical protein [Allosalinactinospora lopnorensis]|uniref:hypothetical protein n=1 Tax=Allosalinactinospora lopnorensis TaxID=1352348 RepID=UPI0012E30290|nr:hypothetical protein [Allosalinactinospora lopnorensis]
MLWLETLLSRLREYVVYAGLAIGGVLTGVPDAWAWAAGALIAQTMRDSVAAAWTARSAPPHPTVDHQGVPARHQHSSPLDAMDPSSSPNGRAPSDPSLTAELLGGPEEEEPRGSGEPEHPIRIRTAPRSTRAPAHWEEGRYQVMREMGAVPDERAEPAHEGGAYPDTGRALGSLVSGRVPRFPQAGRFAVIALTITIWDARVTFVALIIGCAIAVCGEFADHPARDDAR